ncbi:MAG: hypothetical protein JWO42_3368, partial [Chloroflexi bacterium]|nr:hypothetical protein [Chloroflexota bacterium]
MRGQGNAAAAGLIIFSTLWRLPSLGDPPWLNDEGTYATVGRAIVNGEALYRQVWENKPPAVYLLFGAVHALIGPAHLLVGVRSLALVAALIVQIAVYRLVKSHAGWATAMLATAIAGLGLDLPTLDGTSANAEIFLAAATATGMLLLWRGLDAVRDAPPEAGLVARTTLFFAGIAFGVAIMFKLVAGADLVAALAILLLLLPDRRLPTISALLAGVAVPVGAVSIWLAERGILGDAVYATVGYNRGYVTAGQGMHSPIVSVGLLLLPVVLSGAGAWLLWRSRGRQGSVTTISPSPQTVPAAPGDVGASIATRQPAGESIARAQARQFLAASCVWLGLAVVGALASGRTYPHYFLQAVAPLAILVALLVGGGMERRGYRVGRAVAVLLVVWVVLVPVASWLVARDERPTDPPGSRPYAYYAYVWQHLTGGLTDTEFGNRLDPRVERNLAVANYLKAHVAQPRRLYVWGNAPWIYYLSGYSHAARFLSAYYYPPIPGGMGQVIASLRAAPPSYIVVIEPPLPASAALLD